MLTDVRRLHLRGGSDAIHFVSNTSGDETDFDKLRKSIFHAAADLPTWKEDKPVRWIHLENELDNERLNEKNVLSRSDIIQLAKMLSVPINEEYEVNLFLKYQHELGNVIFFEDIRDCIIIKPSWLIDAFKCLVCATDFRNTLLNCPEWGTLKHTGVINKSFIDKLLSFEPDSDFNKNRDYVIEVMIKFDIIVRDESGSEQSYIIPSMIDKKSTPPLDTIFEKYCANSDACKKSSWLCLVFDFLPPAIFNDILVRHMRDDKYKLFALYYKSAIFDIDSNRLKRLVIFNSNNTICLQVWSWNNDKSVCRSIYASLIKNILKLKSKFDVMVNYQVKFMCDQGNITQEDKPFEVEQLKKAEEGLYCDHQSGNHIVLDAFSLATTWMNDQV